VYVFPLGFGAAAVDDPAPLALLPVEPELELEPQAPRAMTTTMLAVPTPKWANKRFKVCSSFECERSRSCDELNADVIKSQRSNH
jgi:hypothetical protein